MSLIDQLDAANLLVADIYNTLKQKGSETVPDASKNTSFLSNTISTIPVNLPTVQALTDSIEINKNTNTYTKIATGNTCYNPVTIDFNVSVMNVEIIDIDNNDYINCNPSYYLSDTAAVGLKTDYYKQLETTSVSNAPRLTAYTVPFGFYDGANEPNILASDKDNTLSTLYGIACILPNISSGINEFLEQGALSYNFVDITLDENRNITNTSYGAEHNIKYVELFLSENINIDNVSIAGSVGSLLSRCKIQDKNETIGEHFTVNDFTEISKYRIYYNIHLMIPNYAHQGNMFVPIAQQNPLIKDTRISLGNTFVPVIISKLEDFIYETSSRMSVNFSCITDPE